MWSVFHRAASDLQSRIPYRGRLPLTEGEVLLLRAYETQGIMQSPLTYIIISATVNFFGGVIIIKAGSVDFSGAPEMIQR